MAIFKAQNFKRNYECTNIVAIVGDALPARFSAEVFKRDDAADLAGLTYLGAEYANGQRVELYGYL
jgi:hypothetical protein